jgi:hypothetical protein
MKRLLFCSAIRVLLPELKDAELMQDGQLSGRIRFLAGIHGFETVTRDGRRFASDLFIHALGNDAARLRLIMRPALRRPPLAVSFAARSLEASGP